jgi:hypothetical protein
MSMSFEHMLDLNRPSQPALSNLALRFEAPGPVVMRKTIAAQLLHANSPKGGRTRRPVRTVEVALERETPLHLPPQAANSLPPTPQPHRTSPEQKL